MRDCLSQHLSNTGSAELTYTDDDNQMDQAQSIDHKLFERLNEAVEENLQNEQFGVTELAEAAHLSKSQLNRKLHSQTGQSASQFIREYRLKKAHELLKSEEATPTEVAYKVGFSSPSYFSTCFNEFYGYPPSELRLRKAPGINKPDKNKWKSVSLLSIGTISILILSYFSFRGFVGSANQNSNVVDSNRSIAVLPFKNLNANQYEQHLVDGVMEEILNRLQRISLTQLSVRSRTSVEAYRNSMKSVTEIGEELEVSHILEGSFQKVDNKAKLVVKLIDAKKGKLVWLEEYDREWSDIFNVQEEVAKLVADELYINLTRQARKAIAVIPTENMVAYDHYLKGKEAYWSWYEYRDKTKLAESVAYYSKAIALDEHFSYAYTGLGRTLYFLHRVTVNSTEKIKMQEDCRRYIDKAIKLDPYNGWAHAIKGDIAQRWDRDSITARANFVRAIKLEPNNYQTYTSYYLYEVSLGNCEKLMQLRNKMAMINPTSGQPSSYYNLRVLECQNDYAAIAALADEFVDKEDFRYYLAIGRLHFYGYLYIQNYDKADEIVNRLKARSEIKSYPLAFEGLLRAMEGNKASALALLDSLKLLASAERIFDHQIAQIYAALGDRDQMYRHIEQIDSDWDRMSHPFVNRPEILPYKNEPRFQELLARSWIPKTGG